MCPSHTPAVGVKTLSEVLFVQRQTICRVSFEIFPDILNWIKFWSIFGKILNVKPWVDFTELSNVRAFVDFAMIPYENDIPVQVYQQCPDKFRNMRSLEIVLLETNI